MSGILGLAVGLSTLVVGVEDDQEGGVRMYLGARWRGIYAIVEDEAAIRELRRAWAQGRHVIVDKPPPDVLYTTRERP